MPYICIDNFNKFGFDLVFHMVLLWPYRNVLLSSPVYSGLWQDFNLPKILEYPEYWTAFAFFPCTVLLSFVVYRLAQLIVKQYNIGFCCSFSSTELNVTQLILTLANRSCLSAATMLLLAVGSIIICIFMVLYFTIYMVCKWISNTFCIYAGAHSNNLYTQCTNMARHVTEHILNWTRLVISFKLKLLLLLAKFIRYVFWAKFSNKTKSNSNRKFIYSSSSRFPLTGSGLKRYQTK